jgi:uncharacterized Zn-finger protein
MTNEDIKKLIGVSMYSCPICDKSLLRQEDLSSHLDTHIKDRSFNKSPKQPKTKPKANQELKNILKSKLIN